MNKDYTKIKLRDFRHNLSQLKDSVASGEIYQIIDRGNPLAYLISTNYEVNVKNKKLSQETFSELLDKIAGKIELRDEIKKFNDPMEGYRYLLRKKYLKK